ncbi:MAG: hypothetical protein J0H42_23295 [Rhizobiales bacterium]|nr:hypothetical protein [Hyphomicrobiales bacterium]
MISDQTIISARAEKQNALGRRMVRRILTASMAAILTLPSLSAWGLDGPRTKPETGNAFETIALPPIPYLESMPWLRWGTGVDTLKVDILLSPILDPSGIKLTPVDRDKERPAIS